MVSYWDTSAVVALLVREPDTRAREAELRSISQMVTWWGTILEARSALERRKREGALSGKQFDHATDRLNALRSQWTVVRPSDAILARAERLLRLHPLRASDALQLAAALLACAEAPENHRFHCADLRLCEAARKEGFLVSCGAGHPMG